MEIEYYLYLIDAKGECSGGICAGFEGRKTEEGRVCEGILAPVQKE